MTDAEPHGPIDFLLVEFPGERLPDEAAAELLALVNQGVIRLFDVVFLRKDLDGRVSAIDPLASPMAELGGFAAFATVRSGLLGDDDISEAATAMEPGTIGLLVVFENAWAVPFVGAALRAGGDVVAGTRIPAPDVIAVLDTLDTADAGEAVGLVG